MACRDAFCSDMSMLQVWIPQWLKAIQTSPEWRGVKSCRNWWKQRNVGWETWQRREGDGKIQGCAKIDASCFWNKHMQVTKMQWCNLAHQDVSDPVVSFQRKLLTSNVLDTGHRDRKASVFIALGMGCRITMGKHENWKSSWGKRGTTNDNNTHLLPAAAKKVCKKRANVRSEQNHHLPIGRTSWSCLILRRWWNWNLPTPKKVVYVRSSSQFWGWWSLISFVQMEWLKISFQSLAVLSLYTWLCCRAFFPVSFRPACCWLDLFSCAWRPRGLKIGCQLLNVIIFFAIFFVDVQLAWLFLFLSLFLARTRWWTPRM